MVLENYRSTLMYSNICDEKDLDGPYGERMTSVIVKESPRHAVLISGDVEDNDERSLDALVVFASSIYCVE